MDLFRRFGNLVIGLLALAAGGFAAGCGGGGGGASFAAQNVRSYDPNYLADMKSLTHWAALPVKVYFAPNHELTPERQSSAEAGIAQWSARTGGLISFAVVQDPAAAQITIQFTPTLGGSLIGWTTWSYDGTGVIHTAESKIATKGMSESDIEWVAAHEFGHALGLDGHSSQAADVMFASHSLGQPWAMTVRDENTARSNYAWMTAGGGSRAVVWGPMRTAEVKCYSP